MMEKDTKMAQQVKTPASNPDELSSSSGTPISFKLSSNTWAVPCAHWHIPTYPCT